MKAPSAKPQPPLHFPIAQVKVGELIERMNQEELQKLLDEQCATAWEAYIHAFSEFRERMKGPDSYRLKTNEKMFRGTIDYGHPLYNGDWADAEGHGAERVQRQLELALKARDWQEVMVCAGMHTVREMLYGRALAPQPTLKGKAAKKVAKKKPAAKKPASTRKAAPAKAGKVDTLKDLVEQAKPLFRKNPDLTREQLIKAIGRRYERITTLAELRALCAGKTPTTNSLKKKDMAAPKPPAEPRTARNPAAAWPFPTGNRPHELTAPSKPKRARRRRSA